MTNQNRDDSEANIDNILFDERLDQDPLFDKPKEFEASHIQPLKDKLLHFARFGNLLTLILGESGTGKSYLLEQFMATLDDNVFVCHIEAQPLYTQEQLFEDICSSVSTEELSEYPIDTDSFQVWLDEIALMSECHIVAIDDAETLSQEVIREICRLSAYQQTLDVPKIQFMLFASHDLATSMDDVGREILDESGIFIIDIPLLIETEAKQWLQYCLHRAGYLANDDELDDLMADNDGNLTNLAEIAEGYANEQLEEEQTEIIEEPEDTVSVMGFWFAGLTVIVIAVLALFFYQKEISQWLFPETAPVKIVEQEPVTVSEIEPGKDAIVDNSDTSIEPKEMNADKSLATTDIVKDINSQPIQEVTKDTENGLLSNEQASDKSSEDDLEMSTEENKLATTAAKESAEENIATPVKPIVNKLSPAESEPDYTLMEQALLDAPDSNYVVQIIGLSNDDSVKKLIAENSNLDLLAYRSLLNGKPWQVIVLPGFTDYGQAQQARLNLPKTLAKFQPWIKSQTKVKAEIKAAVTK